MNWYYFSLGLAMILLLVSFFIAAEDSYKRSIQEFLSVTFSAWFALCFLATLLIGGLALIVKGLG